MQVTRGAPWNTEMLSAGHLLCAQLGLRGALGRFCLGAEQRDLLALARRPWREGPDDRAEPRECPEWDVGRAQVHCKARAAVRRCQLAPR